MVPLASTVAVGLPAEVVRISTLTVAGAVPTFRRVQIGLVQVPGDASHEGLGITLGCEHTGVAVEAELLLIKRPG